jgi:hypothetical protein
MGVYTERVARATEYQMKAARPNPGHVARNLCLTLLFRLSLLLSNLTQLAASISSNSLAIPSIHALSHNPAPKYAPLHLANYPHSLSA